VTIGPGAGAEFIAGRSVRFLPGFHAQQGSEVYAHITTDSTFCDGKAGQGVLRVQAMPKSSALISSANRTRSNLQDMDIKIYPNPNKGRFTVELLNFTGKALMLVYNSGGVLLQQEVLDGGNRN